MSNKTLILGAAFVSAATLVAGAFITATSLPSKNEATPGQPGQIARFQQFQSYEEQGAYDLQSAQLLIEAKTCALRSGPENYYQGCKDPAPVAPPGSPAP